MVRLVFGIVMFVLTSAMCSCSSSRKVIQLEKSQWQEDSLILSRLIQVDGDKYINDSVGAFLKDSTISFYKNFLLVGGGRIELLDRLVLYYSEFVYINVKVKDYMYVKQGNPDNNWDISLYKKETLGQIKIIYKDSVIKTFGKIEQ